MCMIYMSEWGLRHSQHLVFNNYGTENGEETLAESERCEGESHSNIYYHSKIIYCFTKKKPCCLLKATKLQTIKRNFIVYELYLNKIVIKNSIILKYKKQFIIHMNCIEKDFPMITHAEESQEWRRKWQPTPVLLPRKFHGWRSLVGYSPWSHRVRHDWATFHFHSHFLNTMVVLIIALKTGMLDYIFSILLNSKVLCR